MTEIASRIPTFSSREEEAAFWDTHDATNYEHEFKPVKARFAKNLSQPLTSRLYPETLTELRDQPMRTESGQPHWLACGSWSDCNRNRRTFIGTGILQQSARLYGTAVFLE
jgi:hypothetical protein